MVIFQMTGEEETSLIGGEKIEVELTKVNLKNLMAVGDELVQIPITMIDGLQEGQHQDMMKMKDGIVVNQDGPIILVPMTDENLIGEKHCQNGILFMTISLNNFIYVFKKIRAVDNPGEKGGSFDSSGAFHDNHYDDDHHYNMRDEQSREV